MIDRHLVSDAIGAMATITPPSVLASLFKQVMQKLLSASSARAGAGGAKASPEVHAADARAVVLCELALALLPSLDAQSVILLYRVVKPMVAIDDNAALQKRAYRVLTSICEAHPAFVCEPAARLPELLETLHTSLVTCHTSSRQMRVRCVGAILAALDGDASASADGARARSQLVSQVLGEMIACLKDANRKTREAAGELLLSMAQGHAPDGARSFLQLVVGALASRTTHMRSGAVLALARIVHAYRGAPEIVELVPDLLSTVLLLVDDGCGARSMAASASREVSKAVVIFVQAAMGALSRERALLEPLVPSLVGALLSGESDIKRRFRAKIKCVCARTRARVNSAHALRARYACERLWSGSKFRTVERSAPSDLVRRVRSQTPPAAPLTAYFRLMLQKLAKLFGYDAVRAVVPDDDQPLLQHVQRMNGRTERKKLAKRSAAQSERGSRFGGADDDEDDDEDGFSSDGDGYGDDDDAISFFGAASTVRGSRAGATSRAGTVQTQRTQRTHRTQQSGRTGTTKHKRKASEASLMIREDSGGIVDLLDNATAAKIAVPRFQSTHHAESDDDDGNVKVSRAAGGTPPSHQLFPREHPSSSPTVAAPLDSSRKLT